MRPNPQEGEMPENDPSPAPPAPPEPTPPAPPEPPAPPAQPEPPAADGDPYDKDRAMALIEKLRPHEKESKRLAKELEQAQTRLREIEDAEKTELERAQKRLAEYQEAEKSWAAERRTNELRLAVYERAPHVGVASPRLALAYLERNQLIEFDDGGKPVGVDEALTQLLEDEPALRGTQTLAKPAAPKNNAGAGTGPQEPPALTAEELAQAEKDGMTPEEWAAMKNVRNLDDFNRLQAAGRAAGT